MSAYRTPATKGCYCTPRTMGTCAPCFMKALRDMRAKLKAEGVKMNAEDFFCSHGRLKTRDCDECDKAGTP